MVSHDLRSPLTVVKLFADLLAHRSDEYEEDQREAIEELSLNADRLADLIEKMLQLSQLDAGMITLQPTPSDAPALIQQAIDHLADRAAQQGVNVTLTVTAPIPSVELDPVRFEQVVTNLVDSAIKFTPAGGEVRVTIAYQDETLTRCATLKRLIHWTRPR
jgi:signal transduction histidine kinase